MIQTPLYEIRLTYGYDKDGEEIVNLQEESHVSESDGVPLIVGLGMLELAKDTFRDVKMGNVDDDG